MTAPKTLDTPYTAPRIFGSEYRTASLGILLVVTLIAFEGMSVGAVMPAVSKDLNALDLYGMSFSAFLIAGLLANVVAGLWSDRRGHALPFLLGVSLFVVGMALAGAAGSKELFILARAVQGLGGGAVIVAIYVMIARVYVPAARPKVFAALSAAWVLPALIGPGVGGLIAETAGWRWVFYGIVPLVIPAMVMLLPALRTGQGPAPEPGTGPRSRPLAMTLSAMATAGGAGVLLYGVDRLHTTPVSGGIATVAGLVALAVGLPRLLPPKALRFGRGLPTTVMMRGVLSAAFFGVNAFIPLFLTEVAGLLGPERGDRAHPRRPGLDGRLLPADPSRLRPAPAGTARRHGGHHGNPADVARARSRGHRMGRRARLGRRRIRHGHRHHQHQRDRDAPVARRGAGRELRGPAGRRHPGQCAHDRLRRVSWST